jgi:hypothetical protein
MPQAERIVDILAGRVAVGERATVQGWVRTNRGSKAGVSFLNVHDGSCFDALQVVVPSTLGTYQDEVVHLTAGCAVTVTGTITASPGKGQAVELLADGVDLTQATLVRVPPRGRAPAPEDEHLRRGRQDPACPGHGHASLLRRARLLLGAHADPHGQRCRGRR